MTSIKKMGGTAQVNSKALGNGTTLNKTRSTTANKATNLEILKPVDQKTSERNKNTSPSKTLAANKSRLLSQNP